MAIPCNGLNSNPTGLTMKGEITPLRMALSRVLNKTVLSLNPLDTKSKVTINDPGLKNTESCNVFVAGQKEYM